MSQGVIPSGETLSAISRVENVSISWLLTGTGNPYLVACCTTDEEAAELLDELFAEKGWTAHVAAGGGGYSVILSQPGQFEVKGRPVEYTIIEVVAGRLGPAALARVAAAGVPMRLAEVTAADQRRIRSGEVGTWGLFGDKGMLCLSECIDARNPIFCAAGADAAEEGARYDSTNGERELVQVYRSLQPSLRRAALAGLKAMQKSEEEQ